MIKFVKNAPLYDGRRRIIYHAGDVLDRTVDPIIIENWVKRGVVIDDSTVEVMPAVEETVEEFDEKTDIYKMTLAQLKAEAEGRGINIAKLKTKAKLIEAIETDEDDSALKVADPE